jgi:hypothetical protein
VKSLAVIASVFGHATLAEAACDAIMLAGRLNVAVTFRFEGIWLTARSADCVADVTGRYYDAMGKGNCDDASREVGQAG